MLGVNTSVLHRRGHLFLLACCMKGCCLHRLGWGREVHVWLSSTIRAETSLLGQKLLGMVLLNNQLCSSSIRLQAHWGMATRVNTLKIHPGILGLVSYWELLLNFASRHKSRAPTLAKHPEAESFPEAHREALSSSQQQWRGGFPQRTSQWLFAFFKNQDAANKDTQFCTDKGKRNIFSMAALWRGWWPTAEHCQRHATHNSAESGRKPRCFLPQKYNHNLYMWKQQIYQQKKNHCCYLGL